MAKDLGIRLNTILELAGKGNKCLADIGADHAMLPINAVLLGYSDKAIASDINEGPLAKARENISHVSSLLMGTGAKDISKSIQTILAGGIAGLPKDVSDQVDVFVIAGMGGTLITSILDDAIKENRIKSGTRFILSPNTHEQDVRSYLWTNGFTILQEKAITESNHIYLLIEAQYTARQETYVCGVDDIFGKGSNLPDFYYQNILQKLETELKGLKAGSNDSPNKQKRIDEIQKTITNFTKK